MHWRRFVVLPSLRGQKIGPKLARYSFEDLFEQNVDEIHMTARDTTVKIVCDMGGKITGEPQSFYEGNVTPVYLHLVYGKQVGILAHRLLVNHGIRVVLVEIIFKFATGDWFSGHSHHNWVCRLLCHSGKRGEQQGATRQNLLGHSL